jgi:hypothetical protein
MRCVSGGGGVAWPDYAMHSARSQVHVYYLEKKELFLRAAGASLGNSVRYFHFGLRQSNFETASAPPLQVFPPAALCLVFGTRTPNHSPPAQSRGGGSAPDLHFFPLLGAPILLCRLIC